MKKNKFFFAFSSLAPVAQLDRAFACGAKGRRFESCRVYQIKDFKKPLRAFLFAIIWSEMEIIFVIVLAIVVGLGFTAFTGAPYVPSLKRDLERDFLRIYDFGEKDFLIDLGSGDGKVLKVVAERGARAYGIELNPLLVWWSRWRCRKNELITIKCEDFFRAKFPKETTVVYVFGDSRDFERIYHKVEAEAKRLKKKLVLISCAFEMAGVEPKKKQGIYCLYELDGKKLQDGTD